MKSVRNSIVIASGNHLSSNPRVVKEADALTNAGFKVTVVGGAVSAAQKAKDRTLSAGKPWHYVEAFDMSRGGVDEIVLKMQRQLGIVLWRKLRIPNRWQLFYGVDAIARKVREEKADLVIAHWEPALPAAVAALVAGRAAGVDMEDWFSEDLPQESRAWRPVALLAQMERRLLREGGHSTCTSAAMADALAARYGCRRPIVVRNVFLRRDREAIDGEWKDKPSALVAINNPTARRPDFWPVSIHWFSQTVGPGRGIEELLAAARNLSGDFEIHLRGESKKYRTWLDNLLDDRLRRCLHLHPLVDNDELLSRIAEHDVGYCGEPREPANKDLTISNKLFQYLQGGLAVVATDTAGQQEAAGEAPGAVSTVKGRKVRELSAVLQALIDDRAKLATMRAAAWEAGGRLCWENEAPKLVESVERAIGERRRGEQPLAADQGTKGLRD